MALTETMADKNPFSQFALWFNDRNLSQVKEPYAAALGTCSTVGRVSLRTVLVKDYDETGFKFYTNYNSLKGKQLELKPACALLFYWPESDRKIRIEGFTEKLSVEESECYFKLRPRESQLSSWASEQSSVIPDRNYLDSQYDFYKKKFNKKSVEKPPHWGGFILVPDRFEFWQEGNYRLHDRLNYRKVKDSWIIERLAP